MPKKIPPHLPPLYSLRNFVLIATICVEAASEGALMAMLTPILPQRARELGASEAELVLVFAVFPAAVLLLSPLFGYITGVFSREGIIYVGLALSGGTCVVFGVLRSVPWLVVTRFGMGAGSAAVWSGTYALLADYYPWRSTIVIGMTGPRTLYRHSSVLTAPFLTEAATGVGSMLGPPGAAFLASKFGFAMPFGCVRGRLDLCSRAFPADVSGRYCCCNC